MKDILKLGLEFIKKNADYGDAFAKIGVLMRGQDSACNLYYTLNLVDEGIRDTLYTTTLPWL